MSEFILKMDAARRKEAQEALREVIARGFVLALIRGHAIPNMQFIDEAHAQDFTNRMVRVLAELPDWLRAEAMLDSPPCPPSIPPTTKP